MYHDIDLNSLNIDDVENMSMSIRPVSSGLTFIIYKGRCYEERYYQGFLPIIKKEDDWAKAIEELFFANPYLLLPFYRVRLYYEPYSATLLANELWQEDFAQVWRNYITSDEPLLSYKEELQNEEKLFISYYSKPLDAFLSRTHLRLERKLYFDELLTKVKHLSRQEDHKHLVLLLRYGRLDCMLLEAGQLNFYNSFAILNQQNSEVIEGEVIYYLFFLCNSLGLDLKIDQCYFISSPYENKELKVLYKNVSERLLSSLQERGIALLELDY